MEQIKSIFYKEIAYPYSNNQYGLAIIIMMQKKCLYFDSSSFYFVKSPSDNFNKRKHTNNVLCMGDYVEQPEMCSKLWWNISRQKSAANGALMRTSVVGLATSDIEEQAIAICKLTHYDPRCVGSCVIATAIINNLVWNEDLLSYDDIKSIARKYDDRIIEWIDAAYNSQNISMLDLDEPYSMGYTLRTLSAALWCYWHSPSFEEGLFSVVNEGGDADTNAAVACAILGAKFGYDVIPKYYIENLYNEPMYRNVVQNFINQVLNAEREIG